MQSAEKLSITLPPEMASFIRQKVESGLYGSNSEIIREAMRGRLPPEVLARRKTPLDCYPEVATIREVGLPVLPEGHRIACYVDPRLLPDRGASDPDLATSLNAHALDHWLARKRR